LKDWNQRRDALRSMRWVIAGKVVVPKGTLLSSAVPAEDYTYETTITWLFDYTANRLRKEVVQETFDSHTGTFRPSHCIFLFDGTTQTTRRYFPAAGNPSRDDQSPELGIVEQANTVEYNLSD